MVLNEEIKNILQLSEEIQNSLGLNSHLSEMLELQEQIKKSFSGVNMFTEIFETMQNHKWFTSTAQSTIEEAIKSIGLNSKIELPQQAVDSIKSILHQNELLGGSMRALTKSLELQYPSVSQIDNLQSVLNSLSVDLLAFAARKQDWDLINDYEEITEEAVALNESIFDENGITKEGLIELKKFLNRIENKIDKIDAQKNNLFWKLLALIGFILTLNSTVIDLLPKPEYATKQEVDAMLKEQFSIFEKKLKVAKEYRITNRECDVKLKPKAKKLTLSKLPLDFEVTVLEVNHKWVYVSYFDPKDNLPQTGWIMKKYLNKPE
jgi:hypothetical protein